jgi:hypothetical protein
MDDKPTVIGCILYITLMVMMGGHVIWCVTDMYWHAHQGHVVGIHYDCWTDR